METTNFRWLRTKYAQHLRETGNKMATWLNRPSNPERERIVELLTRITAMVEAAAKDTELRVIQTGAEEKAAARVDRLLARYIGVPQISARSRDKWVVGYAPQAAMAGHIEEWMSGRSLLELLESGLVDRLRQCANCSRWFFASRQKKIYCGYDCQQKAYRSTPEFKAVRRAYALRYYHDVLSPNSARKRARARKKGKQ